MLNEITSRQISLQGVASSMQGGRTENQDDWGFADTPLGFVLVVCDGMGGGPGGKTASYLAKNEFVAALQGCNSQSSPVDAVKMAVSRANDALYRKMDETPSLRGMGSTLVAVLISPKSAVVVHLGDSRCYRISNKRIAFRTGDHSLVGELVRSKALTEEQARTSPQSNVIMRGLGNTSNHVPEIEEVPYRKGDRFFLCTDGVWGIMPHDQLKQRLTSEQALSALVSNLSAEVDQIGFSSKGNHDNHTLAAIEMNTDSILKDKMNKLLKMLVGGLTVLLVVSIIANFVSIGKLEAATSKITDLEKNNQDLESSLELYKGVQDGNAKELITKVEVLRYEKELLEESQASQIAKVDSLEKALEELQQKASSSTSCETKPLASGATAKELAQRSLNLFKAMEDAKGNTWKEAAKKKAEYRNKIVEQLLMLDKKTSGKFKSKIDGVIRELRHPDPLTDKVAINTANKNKSKEEYISTGPAKKKIQELAQKVEAIKKQL